MNLNDWTRTIIVDPKQRGEVMVQILRRDKVIDLFAGHPVPKLRLREVEMGLADAKGSDWRLLQNIPTFKSIGSKHFLARLYKDADITFYSPTSHIAQLNGPGSSLVVILAGTCRGEHPLTLFC